MRFDHSKEFHKFLPDSGLNADDLLSEAISYKRMCFDEKKQFSGSMFASSSEDLNLQNLFKDVNKIVNSF